MKEQSMWGMRKGIVTGALALAMIVPTIAAAETPGQSNARRKAADYLSYDAFSRSGLVKQLKYEGFTTAQATYGVKAQHANWSREAWLKAKDYLKFDSFSRSGLIQQLRYEGFTLGQATYGVKRTGL